MQRGAATIRALDKKMRALNVSSSPAPLRGVPPPAGKHITFDDGGEAHERMHAREARGGVPLDNAENIM